MMSRWVGAITAVLLAVLFLADGTSTGLRSPDPAHGHLIQGCYTLFDDLFRTAAPSRAARELELVVGVVLLVVAGVLERSRLRLRRIETTIAAQESGL